MSEIYGVIANVVSDRQLRTGAKVWICRCNGDSEKPMVYGMTKYGKNIEKYSAYKRLTNYRAAWIPEHLREVVIWTWPSKDEASAVAASLTRVWQDVRYFNRDGTEMKRDGISVSAAFDRAAGNGS